MRSLSQNASGLAGGGSPKGELPADFKPTGPPPD